MQWYVINTKPLREADVCVQLEKAHIPIFNPKIKKYTLGRKTNGRLQSLFPSYVFVKADMENGNIHHLIRYTRGVNKVLGSQGYPTPIDPRVIKVIQEELNDDGWADRVEFSKGDKVRVKRGIMKDLIGVLDADATPQERVHVLLKIMQQNTRVQLKCSDLEQFN